MEWDEKRIDTVGQNGNDALHYDDVEYLKAQLIKAQIDVDLWKEQSELWRSAYVNLNKGIIENIKARNAD